MLGTKIRKSNPVFYNQEYFSKAVYARPHRIRKGEGLTQERKAALMRMSNERFTNGARTALRLAGKTRRHGHAMSAASISCWAQPVKGNGLAARAHTALD
jgi:hypothetical protein